MKDSLLYLTVNLASISVPFIASFYPKSPFYKHWKGFFIGFLFMGTVFLPWDILYTHWGVWGFNERYLTGIKIFNLPVEEWMFFICIPYACTFTYFALRHLLSKNPFDKHINKINFSVGALLLILGIFFIQNAYTGVTFVLLGLALIYLQNRKKEWIAHFYLTYLIILIPFFIVNGILTGSWIEGEIVWYDNSENLGIRIGTIPIEDAFYGMLMMLLVIWGYESTIKKTATP